jgi:uncharacterized protein
MPDIIFAGPDGRLEGRYHPGAQPNSPLALVLHPHPLYGGNMNNKIVYTLFHVYARFGFAVLRFNFRGVGRSQGVFDHGQGELSDAASAMDWLQTHNPNARNCWIAGYSFGGWIAMQLLMRRPEVAGFVAVAPPANMFDFNFLAPCPSSGLVVQGLDDQIVPEPDVAKLVHRLSNQRDIKIEYRKVPGATHFFENKLDVLSNLVERHLRHALSEAPSAAA